MKACEMVFKRGEKWICREPGYEIWGGALTGERLIERVPHQDFEYENQSDAMGHAQWYLNPPKQWFPPPPA